jgi:hypothetical protein
MAIARAYKGVGKSTLLRLVQKSLTKTADAVLISATASRVAPVLSGADYTQWIREWKKGLVGHVATEVGRKIGFAWSDDEMSLVEQAEREGAKSRGLLSAILDRFPLGKIQLGAVEISAFKHERLGTSNPEAVVRRWAEGKPPIWLLIDDIDKNFSNTPDQINKVGSFFDAIRELRVNIPEVRVRAVVRPNVWTVVKMSLESMSHMEQYMVDLHWSEEAIRRLLAERIRAYLRRTGQAGALKGIGNDREVIALLFHDPIEWGRNRRPPHAVLYTLSKRRPRWMVELCKVAAKAASERNKARIGLDDILRDFGEFGRRRIEDTIAEFTSYCAEVGELIDAFYRQSEEFSTDELLKVIENNILSHLNPIIKGLHGRARARDVAAFLFQIGFFFARRDRPDGSYEHITFSEKPSLFLSRTALDQGLRWEIHPIFRQALEMRDASGRPSQEGA